MCREAVKGRAETSGQISVAGTSEPLRVLRPPRSSSSAASWAIGRRAPGGVIRHPEDSCLFGLSVSWAPPSKPSTKPLEPFVPSSKVSSPPRARIDDPNLLLPPLFFLPCRWFASHWKALVRCLRLRMPSRTPRNPRLAPHPASPVPLAHPAHPPLATLSTRARPPPPRAPAGLAAGLRVAFLLMRALACFQV